MDMESVFRIHKGNDEYKEISHGGTIIWERAISKTASGDGTQFMPTRSSTSYAALSAVTAFGGTEQRNLPAEYTQVEYIGSSGGQYIDTGVFPSNVNNVKANISFSTLGTLNYILGARLAGGLALGYILYSSIHQGITIYPGAWPEQGKSDAVENNVYSINASIGSLSTLQVDGVEVVSYNTPALQSGDNSLYIFALHGTAAEYFAYARLYSMRLYNDNELVANYIPCRRNSDGVLGLYDTVSGTFFTNAGTGAFTAGPVVVPTPDAPMNIVCNNGVLKARHQSGLPLGYTLLEYIESTGTEYLDTGITPRSTKLQVNFKMQSLDNTYQSFFGAVADPTPRNGCRIYRYADPLNIVVQSSSETNYVQTNLGNPLECQATINNGARTTVVVNGVTSTVGSSANTQFDRSMLIFTAALGSDVAVSGTGAFKLWYFQIIKDDEEKFNGLPARRDSDNELGMYDLVSGQFFTNQGTGSFTAGNTVADPVEVYADGTTETIWVRGKNLLNPSKFERFTSTQLRWYYQDGYLLKAGETYTFSTNYTGCYLYFTRKSDNASLVSGSTGRVSYTPTEDVLVYFRAYKAGSLEDGYNYQLEQGSTATDYEPYYDGGTATCENLLSVGDYTDVQEILAGDITRKIGVKVLDGTELWNYYSVTQGTLFRTQIADAVSDGKDILGVLCNAYLVTSVANRASGTLSGTATNYDFINDNYTTLDNWKAYLTNQYNAGTPVIIVYPLATATTESVTGQLMTVSKDITMTQEITQASMTGLNIESTYLGK